VVLLALSVFWGYTEGMDISSIRSIGLPATAARISSASQDFDQAAAAVTAAASPEAEGGGEDLAGAVVAMREQGIVNQMLYNIYRRQSEQQQSMVDMIR